jgi:transposase
MQGRSVGTQRGAGRPFNARLHQILDKHDFDRYVEALCQRFYADEAGRPGLPPGGYFWLLLIGFSKAWMADRAIAFDGMSLGSLPSAH